MASTDSMNMSLSKLCEIVKDTEAWDAAFHGVMKSWTQLVKAMVFPVVMYRCESWTVEKAERRRIDALELWC